MRRLAIAILAAQLTLGASLLLLSSRVVGKGPTTVAFIGVLAGVVMGAYAGFGRITDDARNR